MEQASQVRIYDPAASVVFLKTRERFGGLSNMAAGFPLKVNGIDVRTSEALYQACRFPHMPEVQRRIIDARSPMTAKMRGKPFRNHSRPDWRAVQVKIMRWSLRVKLAQNWREFGALVLATGDRPIVERSRRDDFWGAKDAEDGSLVGMNVLGRLLMELREALNADTSESLRVVEPLSIPEFLLLEEPIGTISADDQIPRPIEVGTSEDSVVAAAPPSDARQLSLLEQQIVFQPEPLTAGPVHNFGRSVLEPYPRYRNSGVPWLGPVPVHWKTERAKWLFRKMERTVRERDEVVTCFRDGVVTLRNNRRLRGFTESLAEYGYQGIREGDLVIHAMDAFAGAVGVSTSDGKGTSVYSVCSPLRESTNTHYFAFCVREMARNLWILAISKGIRERSTDFRFPTFAAQPLPVPPPSEQVAIVRFLANADRSIRRYIRAKEKLIALLEEQKQVVIHQAVTGRIDVRTGRPYPAYKPSGVEWLGEVPAHWNVRRLRQCGTMVGGMTPSMVERRFWDGEIPWVTPKDMKREAIRDSGIHITKAALRETSIRLIGPPAVLMVVRGMILARKVPIAWITNCVTINQDMKAVVPTAGIKAEFLARALDSGQDALATLIDEAGHGTRRLPTERLRTLAVAIPSEDEQSLVVRFVDQTTTKIDKRIADTRREIDLLREYRARLIADVVTGKLDVRVAAAALPDEPDDPDAVEADFAGAGGKDDSRPDRHRRTAVPGPQPEMTP